MQTRRIYGTHEWKFCSCVIILWFSCPTPLACSAVFPGFCSAERSLVPFRPDSDNKPHIATASFLIQETISNNFTLLILSFPLAVMLERRHVLCSINRAELKLQSPPTTALDFTLFEGIMFRLSSIIILQRPLWSEFFPSKSLVRCVTADVL